MKKRLFIVLVALLACTEICLAKEERKPGKLAYWYCVGMDWLDKFCLKDVDTAYIGLPDNEWRIAFTNSEIGIHSNYTSTMSDNPELGYISLLSTTTPSLDLGFQIGLRSVNFGYSWDVLHAYSQKLNFSLGGKSWGVELLRQKSSNIHTHVELQKFNAYNFDLDDNSIHITNTNLTAWYALNAAHYPEKNSRFAAVESVVSEYGYDPPKRHAFSDVVIR